MPLPLEEEVKVGPARIQKWVALCLVPGGTTCLLVVCFPFSRWPWLGVPLEEYRWTLDMLSKAFCPRTL